MSAIGNKLKKIREIRNYSQEYVAAQIGISQSTLARMEKNETAISEARLKQIAEVLNTTVEIIKNFDDSIIFKAQQGDFSNAGYNAVVNTYQISPELKRLYEEKISLLIDKIKYLEDKLKSDKKKH